jgi:hypothetical protein
VASYQDLVTVVVREAAEPLTLDELLRRVGQQQVVPSANPKKTIRNAVANSRRVGSLGDGRYVYAPRAATGSSFRLLLDGVEETAPLLPIGDEVAACLTINAAESSAHHRVTFLLPTGSTAPSRVSWNWSGAPAIEFPGAFWAWLAPARARGTDSLILRCLDGEHDRFSVAEAPRTTGDARAVAGRDDAVLAVARGILRTTDAVSIPTFFRRLVVRGAFQGEPQPSPLNRLLFQVDRRFIAGLTSISFRAGLTPGLLRLFAARLESQQEGAAIRQEPVERLRFQSRLQQEGLHARLSPSEEEKERPTAAEDTEDGPAAPDQPAQQLYRLQVRLRGKPTVWRIIEILDNQDLERLHLTIQDAFGWDNDHLYAFFLSGKAWDSITEIPAPDVEETAPPFAHEVAPRELELRRGQRFLYLFDFGDELHHDIEVLEIRPAPASGTYPRIVATHGTAPPQYGEYREHLPNLQTQAGLRALESSAVPNAAPLQRERAAAVRRLTERLRLALRQVDELTDRIQALAHERFSPGRSPVGLAS